MSELKITGKIKVIGEKQTFDSGFEKVEFVITTIDQYPQDIKFEVLKDKVENFLKYNKVGADVDVSFNIRGNEYNGKYYNSLIAWKVMNVSNSSGNVTQSASNEEVSDGLPF